MFDTNYRAVIADNEESRSIHYNLRYQVYCLEKGFEPIEKFSLQQETDAFDNRSVHFLIQHKHTRQWVGTARLVLGRPKILPISQYAQFTLPGNISTQASFAELSRLSILKSFRQHSKETKVSEPEVLLGLIRAAKEYSDTHRIDFWLFLCRRSIMRIVGNLGMNMKIVGPPCEHKGVRYPYLSDIATAFASIPDHSLAVATMFARKNTLARYSSLYPSHSQPMAA